MARPVRTQDSPALCRNPVAPQEQIDCDVLLDMAVLLMKEYAEAMGYTESDQWKGTADTEQITHTNCKKVIVSFNPLITKIVCD